MAGQNRFENFDNPSNAAGLTGYNEHLHRSSQIASNDYPIYSRNDSASNYLPSPEFLSASNGSEHHYHHLRHRHHPVEHHHHHEEQHPYHHTYHPHHSFHQPEHHREVSVSHSRHHHHREVAENEREYHRPSFSDFVQPISNFTTSEHSNRFEHSRHHSGLQYASYEVSQQRTAHQSFANEVETGVSNFAKHLVKAALNTAHSMDTTGTCAGGVEGALGQVGMPEFSQKFNGHHLNGADLGPALANSGQFHKVDDPMPGDIGVRRWAPHVVKAHKGHQWGDAFVVVQKRGNSILQANDHLQTYKPNDPRYEGETEFYRKNA